MSPCADLLSLRLYLRARIDPTLLVYRTRPPNAQHRRNSGPLEPSLEEAGRFGSDIKRTESWDDSGNDREAQRELGRVPGERAGPPLPGAPPPPPTGRAGPLAPEGRL